ncbi:MAG: hypothetical protein FWE25_04990 [Lachnospiraceae bacterium]|nr:hypothetical protein [Lachnospiraceae bacterium]
MLITGTLAWSSISQRATNPLEGQVQPPTVGGRIHDHFDGENKDVFAENFGETPLFVRIQLREFLEFNGVSQVGAAAERDDYHTWPVHNPIGVGADVGVNTNGIGNHVSWDMGGRILFMPTFNHRTEGTLGLQTEASGLAIDYITKDQTAAGTNDGSAGYWSVGDTVTETLYFDGGSVTRTHAARMQIIPRNDITISQGSVITMADWNALNRPVGYFWIVDEDGWAYWAQVLMPGWATSNLLDAINVNMPNNVDWNYEIHVIGEFATREGLADWRNSEISSFGMPSERAEDFLSMFDNVLDDISNLDVRDRFFDEAGFVWQILRIETNGDILVILNEPIGSYAWNPARSFVTYNFDGPVNQRLRSFYSEIGQDMRNIARSVNIPADFRVAARYLNNHDFTHIPCSFQGMVETLPLYYPQEWDIAGDLTFGSLGISQPGIEIPYAGNVLFNLSLAEVSRYIPVTSDRQTIQSWYLRSPGNYGAHTARVAVMGDRQHTSSDFRQGMRPALWVSP